MTKLVKLKIAVDSIQKELLFKGQKHVYLDASVFLNDEEDQYGNHGMITQDVSKEDRQAGKKGPILGNAKIVWREGGDSKPTYNGGQSAPAPATVEGDEIPF